MIFSQIKYCNEFLTLALTYITKNDIGKLIPFRVICAFTKNKYSTIPHKILGKPTVWTCYFKGHELPIKNTARHFVFDVWLVFGSILKFVYIEIVSLWNKTIENFSPF